jgi:hypothetical protein
MLPRSGNRSDLSATVAFAFWIDLHRHAKDAPRRDRRAERLAGTFAELAQEYLERHAKKHKNSWAEDERMIDTYALTTKDDTARARFLREALRVTVAETETAMNAGLVPRNLGVLKVERKPHDVTERIPTGAELAELFRSAEVDPSELVSEAERD